MFFLVSISTGDVYNYAQYSWALRIYKYIINVRHVPSHIFVWFIM